MTEPDHVAVGERVALGPLRTDLAATYARWLHDPEVRNGLLNLGVFGLEAEQDWVRETLKRCAELQPEVAAFTIYELADGRPIGTTSLFKIDWRGRVATFGILLGERRGAGLGTEATRLALDWGFDVLGLSSVVLEVRLDNAAAIAAYEHAGFARVGVRRRGVMVAGRPTDLLLMDAVSEGGERD